MYITANAPRTNSYGCPEIRFQYRGADLGITMPNDDTTRSALGIPLSAAGIVNGQRLNVSGWGWSWRMDATPSRLEFLGLRSTADVRERAIGFWEDRAKKSGKEASGLIDTRNELWHLICEARERPDLRERASLLMDRSNGKTTP